MTQYLLSVHGPDEPWEDVDPESIQRAYADVERFNDELRESGSWVFAHGLQPSSTATVVTSDNGKVTTTDGPYLETKEHLGGFWVIEVDDLDVALDWAGKASAACQGPVEVRPFQQGDGA